MGASLDAFEVLLISIAGVVAVVAIVICSCTCCLFCCGGSPTLCCWATGLLACLGLNRPRGDIVRYETITTTAVLIPPPPTVVYSSTGTSIAYVEAVASAPYVPEQQQQQQHHHQQQDAKKGSKKDKGMAPMQGHAAMDERNENTHASAPPLPSSATAPHAHDPSLQANRLNVPPPPKDTQPRDLWALIVFFFVVCLLTTLAIRLGLPSLGLWEKELTEKSHIPTTYSPEATHSARNLAFLCIGVAVAGDVLAVVWLQMMLKWSTALITSTIYSTIGGSCILALFSLSLGTLAGFFIFSCMAFAGVYLLREERSKIFLSSANLGTACRALLEHTKLLGVAYIVLLLQLAWTMLWTLAALGVYSYMAQENHSHQYKRQAAGENTALVIFLAVALYWGQQVCENVLRCTVVGVIASWWFTPEVRDPVGPSLARAAGPSLGSICVGSLLVSLIEGLRAFVRGLMNTRCLTCCGGCLLDYLLACVEAAWQQFNRFAFVFIGVWGYPYSEAAHLALELFEAKGWQVVLNDYLIGNVLFLGSLLIGGLTACLGVFITHLYPSEFAGLPDPATFIAITGFFLGFGGCLVLIHVLSAAVDTIFVCFAADPGALQRNRPAEYAHLKHAWQRFVERDERHRRSMMEEERMPIINVIRVQI